MQGVITDGGVQWMTAGRGIIHSEMPVVTQGDLWGFQLWINLPKKDKMTKPQYQGEQLAPLPAKCGLLCVACLIAVQLMLPLQADMGCWYMQWPVPWSAVQPCWPWITGISQEVCRAGA